MTRYADPLVCPDCSAALPAGATACPSCGLLLRHPLSGELFAALQRADDVLGRLRLASTATASAAVPTPAMTPTAPPTATPQPQPQPSTSFVPAVPPLPVAADRPRRHGLRPTSVPAILLGLGALCLLVAAVIFLAVAWSWLGVGGRTAVLVGLTVASGALGAGLARRGLRVAGEALSTVALGLLALDVLGAGDAGWLGDLTGTRTPLAVGLVVLAASVAWAGAQPRLVAPQLVAGIAFLTAWGAALDLSSASFPVEALSVVAAAGLAAWGLARGAGALPWIGLVTGGLAWLVLATDGLASALGRPSFGGLWAADGTAWALLAAAALLLLPLTMLRQHLVRVVSLASAISVVVGVVALPVVDEGLTSVTVVALVVALLGAAVATAVPRRWAALPLLPAVAAAVPAVTTALGLLAQSVTGVLEVGDPFTATAGVRVDPLVLVASPWLLAPTTAVLLVLGGVVLGRHTARVPLVAPLTAVALAAVATLGLLPTPLWVVTGALLLVAAVLATLAARDLVTRPDAVLAVTALVLGTAVVTALPSAGLTALAAGATALVAGSLLALPRGRAVHVVSGALLPIALAGTWWSLGEVLDLDVAARGLPVLVAVGLVALALPRPEAESAAGLAALVGGLAAIDAAADQPTALALHLTVAGALVTATSLLHEHRRYAAVLGGLLLAAATWVRLADLGVSAPEAYTLPTATVLVLLGLRRLHLVPESPTSVLLPGLLLATVPSLLWAFTDPVSLRAALLGVGCLALAVAGAWLRWNVPLLVGASVGGLLVLRELAPYAAQTPQWVLIGLAGALLTVVGVTWESRLAELRQAAGFVERLR